MEEDSSRPIVPVAFSLHAASRTQRPSQEYLKRRPEVGFQEADGQTQVSLLGKAEPRWTQVLPCTALTRTAVEVVHAP